MFSGCKKIKSLDISNFNLSKVKLIGSMFSECENLEYINFNYNINLSSITDTTNWFNGCKKLKYLDLSFLDSSLITNIDYMFFNCENLQYLNMPNFDTSYVVSMNLSFAGCRSLKYLNIPFFIDNNNLDLSNTFNEIGEIYYCIKDNSNGEKIIEILSQKNSINECSNLCFSKNGKLILEKNICVDDCSEDDEYKYEYKKRCYRGCDNYYSYNKKECLDEIPTGFYLNSSSLKTINKCPNKCQLCSNESIKYDLCISCNNKYSSIIKSDPNINLFIDCIKNIPSENININNTGQISNIDEECSAFNFLNNICSFEYNNILQNKEDIINKIKKGIESHELKSLLSNVTGEQKKDIEI